MIYLTGFRDLARSVASLRATRARLASDIDLQHERLKQVRLQGANPCRRPKETALHAAQQERQRANAAHQDAVKRVDELTKHLTEVRRVRQELRTYREQLAQAIDDAERAQNRR